jgi:hypothetical protein
MYRTRLCYNQAQSLAIILPVQIAESIELYRNLIDPNTTVIYGYKVTFYNALVSQSTHPPQLWKYHTYQHTNILETSNIRITPPDQKKNQKVQGLMTCSKSIPVLCTSWGGF